MCGGEEWEQSAWSPFGRARVSAEQAAEPASRRAALEPEEALHLGPRGEAEDDEDEDEQRQRDREAQARELRRTAPLHAQPSLRPVEAGTPSEPRR